MDMDRLIKLMFLPVFLTLVEVNDVTSLYIPGLAPVDYHKGDKLDAKAVKMTSTMTQLPYGYYTLPFCRKSGELVYKSENLGEILRGDRIVTTAYDFKMKEDQTCKLACNDKSTAVRWGIPYTNMAYSHIKHDYKVHLMVDNLPCVSRIGNSEDPQKQQFEMGYPLGHFDSEGRAYINNHLDFIISYHTEDEKKFRVVGCEIKASSINMKQIVWTDDQCSFNSPDTFAEIKQNEDAALLFTYSVKYEYSNVRFAFRWDAYLKMSDAKIHWFSIINSLVVVIFLTGIIAMIIIRTLRRDIAKYNNMDEESDDSTLEETGWKLVHGDVFRPPRYPRLFGAIIGSGLQIFGMSIVVIFFAMLGMLSPASRGSLMSAMIFLYVLMGTFAGYFASRLYRTIRGKEWKKHAFMTGTLFPSIVFGICFFLNFFIWGKNSSGAVPFTTMIWLVFIWFCISVPLVFVGAYFGFRKPYQTPIRTNQIPRQVPTQKWYMHIIPSLCISGLLPFGSLFIELFFIFTAIWQDKFYYLFGFLFIVFIILIISVSQISIVLVYFQLCNEDYNWWWKSLISSGGSALYMFLYAVFYFHTRLEITEFIPTLLYFGYTAIMCLYIFLLTSTIGFYSAYIFLRRIYSSVKID